MKLTKIHRYSIFFLLITLIIFLFWIRSIVWGPFNFENMDVSNNKIVYESESENEEHSIKVFYYSGPTAYFEYTYIGALYKGDNFIRNIFWIGPSGNDFEIVWLSDNSILLKKLNEHKQQVELDILKDKYDFR